MKHISLNNFLRIYKTFLDNLHPAMDNPCDKVLWHLLELHKNELSRLFEDCQRDNEEPATSFHKMFRQTDVIDKYTDMAIWICLMEAKWFWEVINNWHDENWVLCSLIRPNNVNRNKSI